MSDTNIYSNRWWKLRQCTAMYIYATYYKQVNINLLTTDNEIFHYFISIAQLWMTEIPDTVNGLQITIFIFKIIILKQSKFYVYLTFNFLFLNMKISNIFYNFVTLNNFKGMTKRMSNFEQLLNILIHFLLNI